MAKGKDAKKNSEPADKLRQTQKKTTNNSTQPVLPETAPSQQATSKKTANNSGQDRLETFLSNISDIVSTKINDLKDHNTKTNESVINEINEIKSTQNTILDRLQNVERSRVARNDNSPIFSEEDIEEGKRFGLDLDVRLVAFDVHTQQQFSLAAVKFSRTNCNLFGLKILNRIFTDEELVKGCVEPKKTKLPPLDLKKMNLIKAGYVFKFQSIQGFLEKWPSIAKSLNQKIIDLRNKNKKKIVDDDGDDESEDDLNIKMHFTRDNGDEDGIQASLTRTTSSMSNLAL